MYGNGIKDMIEIKVEKGNIEASVTENKITVKGKKEGIDEIKISVNGTEYKSIKVTVGWIGIYNENDLINIKKGLDKKYILANDIVLTKDWIPLGDAQNHFIGTLDGNNCRISGLSIKDSSTVQGLFSFIGSTGEIRNMKLQGSIYGKNNLGLICSQNYGKLENIAVNGEISGDGGAIGGITGRNWREGQIIGCSASIVIKKWGNTGYDYDKGGIVGINNGTVENSYSKGRIEGDKNIGGIAGSCIGGVISSTYSITNITALDLNTCGGIAGIVNDESIINASYWCSEMSSVEKSVGGTELTLTQMKEQSSYEGWDFENVWIMKQYPELRCFQN